MQTPQMEELSWNGTSPLLSARTTIALDMRNGVVYICLAEGATGFFPAGWKHSQLHSVMRKM